MQQKPQTSIKQSSLSEMVANQMRRMIWDGELPFGERLLEPDLSSRFGVSRSSLREALQVLEYEGLVKSEPRKGAHVSTFTDEDLREIYECRLTIEIDASLKALKYMTDHDIEQLESIVDEMKLRIDDEKWTDLLNLDLKFHSYLVSLCGNSRLIHFYQLIQIQIRTFLSRLSNHYTDRNSLYLEHQELLAAIKTKDSATTERVLREHINDAGNRLFQV
jgi:DNA-binding GntR family transcriptional regulator